MTEYSVMWLPVVFPAGQINCQNCWLMESDPHCRERKVCRAMPMTINDIHERGFMCPLVDESAFEEVNPDD